VQEPAELVDRREEDLDVLVGGGGLVLEPAAGAGDEDVADLGGVAVRVVRPTADNVPS
jgi:hypothetical protein